MPARPSYRSGFAPETGQPRYPELWRGCVGAWAPCLGPTGLTLKDNSGRRKHGTFTLMDQTAWQMDAGQYALNFADLSNDRIDVSSSQWGMEEGAFCCWVKKIDATTASKDYLIWTHFTTNTDRILFELETQAPGGTALQFAVAFGTNFTLEAAFSSTISTGVWYHVLVQWKNGFPMQLWVNGLLVGSSTNNYTTKSTTSTEQIGNYTAGNNFGLGGNLDDIRRYTRLLSSTEIRLLARRRGIAYELEPRRYGKAAAAAAYKAYWARYNQLLGAGPR